MTVEASLLKTMSGNTSLPKANCGFFFGGDVFAFHFLMSIVGYAGGYSIGWLSKASWSTDRFRVLSPKKKAWANGGWLDTDVRALLRRGCANGKKHPWVPVGKIGAADV